MKKYLALLLVFCMVFALCACGAKEEPAPAPAAPAGDAPAEAAPVEKQQIVVAFNDASDTGENGFTYKWIKSVADKWNSDEYEIVIQNEPVSDSDFTTKMHLQLSDPSTAPDIVLYDGFQLQSDISAGYFIALDELAAGWDGWNNGYISEHTKRNGTGIDGVLYGIPAFTDTRCIWINKDLFDQAGLGKDWQPTTWAELTDGLATVKDATGVIPIYLPSSEGEGEKTTMQGFLMYYYGTGERLVDDATGIWNVNTQGLYDTFKLYSDIYANGLGMPEAEILDSHARNTATHYFKESQLAAYQYGTWYASKFLPQNSPWEGFEDIIKPIKVPMQNGGGFISLSGGSCLAISTACECPEAAFDFIAALFEDVDAYVDYLIGGGNLSIVPSASENEKYVSEFPFLDEAIEYLEFSYIRPANENYATGSSYIASAVEKAVTDGPEAALEYYNQAVTDLVGAEFVKDGGCLK